QGSFRGLGAKPVMESFHFREPVLANLPRDRMQALEFRRQGTGYIYYTVSLRYAIPSELQSFRDEGIGVFLNIFDISTGEEISGSALVSGRTYRGVVRVSSSRNRTFLALRVPVPSGAEILDATFVTTAAFADRGGVTGRADEGGQRGSPVSHQVILDNEIQFFWDNFNRGDSTVSFLFRAVRRGVFPTPPVQAELMYEAEIFGRSQGLLYTIE
ncbi:MAG: alpha-2-macroglobulin, partial [Spirochaetes bacterium]|nr:alpha-2-macroglobulin [Spirochaetota bacterium]